MGPEEITDEFLGTSALSGHLIKFIPNWKVEMCMETSYIMTRVIPLFITNNIPVQPCILNFLALKNVLISLFDLASDK